jgi:hypothetical protein
MAGWPITIAEAARRLDIPYNAACVMVASHRLAVSDVGASKVLDQDAFEKLKEVSVDFVRSRKPRRAKAGASA